jgi:hypothetical protein
VSRLIASSNRFAPDDEPLGRVKSRVSAMEVITETTPAKDARDVSKVLKSSTIFDSPVREKALVTIPTTPSSLPPLPPSPERSILSRIPQPSALIQSVQALKSHEMTSTVKDSWISLRVVSFLSLSSPSCRSLITV